MGIAALFTVSTVAAAGITAFTDVPANHWAATSIATVNDLGLMTGPGNMPNKFDPAGIVNRAQLATVITRLYNRQNQKLTNMQEQIDLLTAELHGSSSSRSSSSSSLSSSSRPGSSSVSSSSSSSVSSSIRVFHATLNGLSEVPPISTAGTGTGTFTLNGNTLAYFMKVANLSSPITAMHFHEGAMGVAGPVVQPISFSGSVASGSWTGLTDAQKVALVNGNIYVNVHTTNNPNGEIRGQVRVQ
ncbi:MAG: hypothetical protein JWM56_1168 [Candidatus Peribacteria bacterium]|nr:hypothetical protein [Candidatus Peribacteria bacterium]